MTEVIDENVNSSTINQNPLSRKLKKVLELRLDNEKETLDALKALSTFFGSNTLRSRRNLRGDVEKRGLEISEEFEKAFSQIKLKLDELQTDVQSMAECCADMKEGLKKSKESTADLIEKTNKLQFERKQIELKENLAQSFLDKFQLKSNEIQALRSIRSGVITNDFFEALHRSKKIHQDCKILLRSKQQTAGLEIMESMAIYQETAYEKLYRWAQETCRGMTDDSPDVSSALCAAMEALQDRQVLFKYTLEEFSVARRTAVVRCFIDALTQGGPGGTPRPIELYSHDPIRYVGDILAWLHQAVASEKELLLSLLKKANLNDSFISIPEILSSIVEGVSRPFKVRVEQVITSETGPAILFRLGNLLKFYTQTLQNLCGGDKEFELILNIKEMHELSYQMFYNSLSGYGSQLTEKIDVPPPDLSTSHVVNDTMQTLKDVLASHDSAITPLNERRQDYEKIFSYLLDPLFQYCNNAANQLNKADKSTFMLNNIYHIQSSLAVYEFTDNILESLTNQSEELIYTLVEEQFIFMLRRLGLDKILNLIKDNESSGQPLSRISGLELTNIELFTKKLDQHLSKPDLFNIPQLELIRSARMRDKIRIGGADNFLESYKVFYESINKKENLYSNPSNVVSKTPCDIENLLK